MGLADKGALANVVIVRTGKSRPEAKRTARQVGQKTAEGVPSAALWAFGTLPLSAIAAAVGGYLATPKDIPAGTPERLCRDD